MDPVDSDWNEFRDSQLVVRAPAYLRQQRSMMFFTAPKKRRPGQNIVLFSIGVTMHPDLVEGARSAIEAFKPGLQPEMGRELMLIRRGKPEWLDNGLELLFGIRDLATGHIDYNLQVAYERSRVYLDVRIMGDGELEPFEHVARSIIQSIRLVRPDEVPVPVKRTRSQAGGLKRADKARLVTALEGLPPELAYLRKPILAIAKEDQDLLGSGEADIEPLVKALRQRAGKEPIAVVANRDADDLRAWLEGQPDHTGAWAGPAWFVEGALRGISAYGDAAERGV